MSIIIAIFVAVSILCCVEVILALYLKNKIMQEINKLFLFMNDMYVREIDGRHLESVSDLTDDVDALVQYAYWDTTSKEKVDEKERH